MNSAERRDSVGNESTFTRNAAAKGSVKKTKPVDSEDSQFHEDGDKDRYLITYADLITLLLGLFIILYAMSNIDVNKYKGVVSAMGSIFGSDSGGSKFGAANNVIPKPSDKLAEDLNSLVEQYNYGNSIRLEQNERGVTIHILDDVLFPPGKATLNDASRTVLSRLADVIKPLPNDIRIEGHTDNIPISTSQYPSNWHLSVDRALSTGYYLIQEEGILADKVSVVGYAEYRPIASNDTPQSRTQNRRVDIVILKK
ncbi:MAG: OmpA family protein [Melioribacteraceae bacterium]|nr:OmpA family protein [Melioribacteraceae bacterium]